MSIQNIVKEIKADTDELLDSSFLTKSKIFSESVSDIDEVSLYDINGLQPATIKNVDFNIVDEKSLDSLKHGIKVPQRSIEEELSEISSAAVDGSRAKFIRTCLTLLVSTSASASFMQRKTWSEPLSEITDFRTAYIIANHDCISSSFPQDKKTKILSFNKAKGYELSINAHLNKLEAESEFASINRLLSDFPHELDLLLIDGPLYRIGYTMDDLKKSVEIMNGASEKGITPVAIVKRPTTAIYKDYVCQQLDRPNWYWASDVAFLESILSSGSRTPFFTVVNRGVETNILEEKNYRLCCYLKIPSERIVRIELPFEFFDIREDIINTILAMSRYNSGRLPIPQARAHNACKIDFKKQRIIESTFDNQLKMKNIPITHLFDGVDLK